MCFTRPVTRWESSGSVSRWSQKLITNYGPMEAVARSAHHFHRAAGAVCDDLHGVLIRGPRIALALSEDLFHWERIGLAIFKPYEGVDFNDVANKDALLFPVAISDPAGQPAMALIHRPLFPGTGPDETLHCGFPRVVDILRESIWISYHSLVNEVCDKHHHLCHFDSHRRLATPVAAWEQLKIGGGHAAGPDSERMAIPLSWSE